jgi:hypothetical protein
MTVDADGHGLEHDLMTLKVRAMVQTLLIWETALVFQRWFQR